MNKINALLLGSSFLSFAFPVPAQKSEKKLSLEKIKGTEPKNVIFILTDDHRYDYMGFTGKVPWLETPNMDRMAAEGAYFINTFVTTALCSPSRASLLTGQYSHVHTVVDNSAPMPENLVFFPQYLQKAGYQTSFFGKWHMGNTDDAPQPGFSHWESFRGQGVYYNPTLNINGQRISYTDSAYVTDLLTEHAIGWMKERDKNKPFLLYLSHKAVHSEFAPAKRHKGKYEGKKINLPKTYDQTKTGKYLELGWPEWVKQQRTSWHGVDYMYNSNSDMDDLIQGYCETLMGVDESIGAILDFLEEEGLAESTLVIYMGDNGFSWGEHGLIDKRHFYEESAKVPLLVRCPELMKGGQTITSLVQNIDIAPTILEWAGLQKPDYMPGKSFIQLCKGDTANWRDEIFYEYYWEYDFPMTPTVFGVRSEKYKYIRYNGLWDRNEFYDLKNDPDEMYNLLADPKLQPVIKQYVQKLYTWLETTGGMQIPLKPTINYRMSDYKNPMQY
jgi:N-acetylglucosamine-6-sulfatase